MASTFSATSSPYRNCAGAGGPSEPVAVADACVVSPALRAWVECLVDTRVDASVRDGDIGEALDALRREVGSDLEARLADEREEVHKNTRKLELQFQTLLEAQAGMQAGLDELTSNQGGRLAEARASHFDSVLDRLGADLEATGARIVEHENHLRLLMEREDNAAFNEEFAARLEACERRGEHFTSTLDALRSVVSSHAEGVGLTTSELQTQQEALASRLAAIQHAAAQDVAAMTSNLESLREIIEDFRPPPEPFGAPEFRDFQRQQNELRAELRRVHKEAKAGIELIDEQLWRTDSNLSRRIDDLAQALRGALARSHSPNAPRSASARRSHSPQTRAAATGHHPRHSLNSVLEVAAQASEELQAHAEGARPSQ
mmetsp:Transcript_89244/g.195624  ORF Transcript_89244/g.195624 Transcript_89244/m.195624 type:complete len:374 (-) Transcript_89244:132-1253(-)